MSGEFEPVLRVGYLLALQLIATQARAAASTNVPLMSALGQLADIGQPIRA
jgi:hypothetical protein